MRSVARFKTVPRIFIKKASAIQAKSSHLKHPYIEGLRNWCLIGGFNT